MMHPESAEPTKISQPNVTTNWRRLCGRRNDCSHGIYPSGRGQRPAPGAATPAFMDPLPVYTAKLPVTV